MRLSHARANGHILWAGLSRIDGAPVVAIAVGEMQGSTNVKTGSMLQTYILRADSEPIEAARSGDDASICGDCPLRATVAGTLQGRGCYVNLGQGPTGVYRAWQRGAYPWANDRARVGAGREVRVGTYGDPAAVPDHVWRELLSLSVGHTGYTHQPDMVPEMRDYLMASARSAADGVRLRLMGWRTFEVLPQEEAAAPAGTIMCPSVTQGLHCQDCLLCDGAPERRVGVKSIAIPAHGSGAKYV